MSLFALSLRRELERKKENMPFRNPKAVAKLRWMVEWALLGDFFCVHTNGNIGVNREHCKRLCRHNGQNILLIFRPIFVRLAPIVRCCHPTQAKFILLAVPVA